MSKVNRLRNLLAHRLSPNNIDVRIQRYVDFRMPHLPAPATNLTVESGKRRLVTRLDLANIGVIPAVQGALQGYLEAAAVGFTVGNAHMHKVQRQNNDARLDRENVPSEDERAS
ncbi:hypothetical protein [Bordetella bronchialis]|nr:hypothetical protein [Bordetella bronchialis]